jgi:hypothetical protein
VSETQDTKVITKFHVLKVNNTIIKHKESIANTFNKYFSTIAHTKTIACNTDNSESGRKINPLYYLNQNYSAPFENIKWHYTSTAEIKKIIKTLRNKSSYGYDKIPVKILKISLPYIMSPFTYICIEALSQGTFPDRLKYAVIKPIYKTADKCEPSNYRPISLSSFSKVFERLIYNRLYEHINQKNILDSKQFGFRPDSSTEMASFKLVDEILKSMNKRYTTGGIFCDLQKAFDCANQDIF